MKKWTGQESESPAIQLHFFNFSPLFIMLVVHQTNVYIITALRGNKRHVQPTVIRFSLKIG